MSILFSWCENLSLYIFLLSLLSLRPMCSSMLYQLYHLIVDINFSSVSSVMHCLFRRDLFNYQVFMKFLLFLLLLIFSFIALWSYHMCGILSVPLHLLTNVLWASRWSIWGHVPCASEKKVYFGSVGGTLWISCKSIGSHICFSYEGFVLFWFWNFFVKLIYLFQRMGY